MLDIKFYENFDKLISSLNKEQEYSVESIFNKLEAIRSNDPYIYNIETTNRCNMKCQMCPRTTMMKRKNEDINREIFLNIVDQIRPHTAEEWANWKTFCENKYGIYEDDMSENHFFLYIIPKVIQLHGLGDPLLDKNLGEYIKILSQKNIQSYFSCNPSNINLEATYEMLDNGLDYIKYSIESVDDSQHKEIRGQASNFSKSFDKIMQVLNYKKQKNLSTTIVITMIDLNRTNQKEDYDKLLEAFKGLDVYIYLKSENSMWYRQDYHQTKSIHWAEMCKHPWMTMSIQSNGEAIMCFDDFSNEVYFGDTNKSSLKEIWNSEEYKNFRLQHLNPKCSINKCVNQCDMKLVGESYSIV